MVTDHSTVTRCLHFTTSCVTGCTTGCEQRSSDRSRSTKTVPRGPVADDVTLAACSAEDRVQSGSADVQSPQHLDAVVPATPSPGSRTRPQPAINHYGAVSTFHDDNVCEVRFSMLCTGCLELITENCSP